MRAQRMCNVFDSNTGSSEDYKIIIIIIMMVIVSSTLTLRNCSNGAKMGESTVLYSQLAYNNGWNVAQQ